MEKVYDRFRERRIQRWTVFIGYVVYLVIVIAVGTYLRFNIEWFYNYWTLGNVLGLLISFFYLMSRPWASENYEISIFIDVYDAFKDLDLISGEEAYLSFYAKKASKKLKKAILHIGSLAYKLEGANSTLAKKFAVPLRTLQNNLETRILPRISEQKEVQTMVQVLRGIAQMFSEFSKPLSIEDIASKNKDLERFEAIPISKQPSKIRIILSRESFKLSFSILLGFIIIFMGAFGHSLWYKYDLAESLGNLANFLALLAVGTAIGLGIYEVRKRK